MVKKTIMAIFPIKFSVIIPTYNRGYMIMPTLDSLFDQTCQDFEIIVVDNCSTDNTEEILKPLVDANKIRFIKHDKNYERAKSRNTGMENARGEYVTFLDSDDFLYKNCLADAVEFLDNNPGKRIFHCLYELVDENQKRIKGYSFPTVKNAKSKILVGNFLACIGIFLHQDVYSKMRFDTSKILTGSEDHEFWIRVLGEFPDLGRIDNINAGIQEHPNRTMNQVDVDKSLERKMYIYNKLVTDSGLKKNYPNGGPIFKAYSLTFAASACLDNREKRKAHKFLFDALKANPSIVFNNFFLKVLILSLSKF